MSDAVEAIINAIQPGSWADRVGLRAGDRLLRVNDHPVRDVVDVQFYAAGDTLAVVVNRGGRKRLLQAPRRYGEPLGMTFSTPTFDGIRRCDNHCAFCFVAQMPPGLRRSLYVRDDDYRYSFLFGSYITLTNLDDRDWARLEEQVLTPLYVSVHATDPTLRRRMLRNPTAPDVRGQIERLGALGITVHTQVVLVPGVNDGPHLDRTIGELADRYPVVQSVSVVPVGLTRYHRGGGRVPTDAEARAVYEQVTDWQTRLRERLGVGFVHLADEWYLRLGRPVPSVAAYDGLDLTENGVGLVSRFRPSAIRRACSRRSAPLPSACTVVTGTLFAPWLTQAIAGLDGAGGVEVVPVVNRFFGETVTVAGLLTGRDVAAQLTERGGDMPVVLPPAMFGGPEGQTLDEMLPDDIAQLLGRAVIVPSEGRQQ